MGSVAKNHLHPNSFTSFGNAQVFHESGADARHNWIRLGSSFCSAQRRREIQKTDHVLLTRRSYYHRRCRRRCRRQCSSLHQNETFFTRTSLPVQHFFFALAATLTASHSLRSSLNRWPPHLIRSVFIRPPAFSLPLSCPIPIGKQIYYF